MRCYLTFESGTGGGVKYFTSEEEMLEYVRKRHNMSGYKPDIYYGEKVELEPAEVVKGWKVKQS